MTIDASREEIKAAAAYEAIMVPAMMDEWAGKVVAAAQIQAGHRVLDVACGTGVVSRRALSRVGSSGTIIGLDANRGMLAVAAQRAPDATWRHGVAEQLPFADGAFDRVVSQFGLMFFRNRPGAIAEMLRVLVRGGRFAVAVWDSLERIPVYATEVALLERLAGARAADALRAPFVLGDRGALLRLFHDGGAADASIATDRAPARFPSIRTLMEVDLRGWLPVMGVPLPDDTIQRILGEAERELAPFAAGDGTVTFDQSAHIITGTKS
jgi:SAM-dependent methyltransferase